MNGQYGYKTNPHSLFRKYAKLVTWFANTTDGRDFIEGHYRGMQLPDQKFDLFLPNGYRIITDIKPQKNGLYTLIRKTVVTTKPVFSRNVLLKPLLEFDSYAPFVKDFDEAKRTFAWLCGIRTYKTQRPGVLTAIYLTVTTVRPDADPETTSTDGRTFRDGLSEVWATMRAGAGNGASAVNASGVNSMQILTHSSTNPNWGTFIRSGFVYDGASVPDTDTISAAQNRYYVGSKTDDFTDSISLVGWTPTSNTNVVSGDHVNYGTTKWATDNTIAGLTTGAYNTWDWLLAQLSNISKTVPTPTGLRCTRDNDNSEPAWGATKQSAVGVSYADEAGTTQDPELLITHAAADSGAPDELMTTGVGR